MGCKRGAYVTGHGVNSNAPMICQILRLVWLLTDQCLDGILNL